MRTISKTINLVNAKPRLADMERFILTVKLNPDMNRKQLLIDTFKFDEEELEMMLFLGMFRFDHDVASLENQLDKICRLDYENFIKEELERLQKQFPTKKTIQIELFILNENDTFVKEKLGGVSAFTDYDGRICFAVLPEENVRDVLKSVLTHEFHHHWRIHALNINETNETLLDRMILEGLAEHFVRIELGDNYIGPYKDALTEYQARELWENTYKCHVNDRGGITDLYMFGDEQEGLPFWGGYSIGYYLVKWYLEKNGDISIEELSLLNSDKFIV